MKLKTAITVQYAGAPVTLPKGTEIMRVPLSKIADSVKLYAVESESLLIRLTGNTHDPKYRYCFVPAEMVEE